MSQLVEWWLTGAVHSVKQSESTMSQGKNCLLYSHLCEAFPSLSSSATLSPSYPEMLHTLEDIHKKIPN